MTNETRRMYAGKMGSYGPTSPEKERILGKRIRDGDKQALEELVFSCLPLAINITKKYLHPDFDDDIVQSAIEGEIEAAKTYDPQKGRFMTYAEPFIKSSVFRFMRKSSAMPTSAYARNKAERLKKILNDYVQGKGKQPTLQELSHLSGWDENSVIASLRILASLDPERLDSKHAEAVGCGVPLEEIAIRKEAAAHFAALFKTLTEDEKSVVVMRIFNTEKSFSSIGEKLGISGQSAERLMVKALRKFSSTEPE